MKIINNNRIIPILCLLFFTSSFALPAHAVLLVSSFLDGEVASFDSNTGAYLGSFASMGDGASSADPLGLVGPHGIRENANGMIYVGDFTGNKILRYTAGGVYVDTIVTNAISPHGFTFGANGDIFVNNVATSGVDRYDSNGNFLENFVTGGSGGLLDPREVLFGPDGNMYVTSRTAPNAVFRYDGSDGSFIDAFAIGGGINQARGALFGPDGNLYVTSDNTNQIMRYDGMTGAFLGVFINGGTELVTPNGITFGPDGNFYVGSRDTQEVLRYDGTTGQFIDVFASGIGAGLDTSITYLTFTEDSFAVPLPGSLILFLSGILGLAGVRRRRAPAA